MFQAFGLCGKTSFWLGGMFQAFGFGLTCLSYKNIFTKVVLKCSFMRKIGKIIEFLFLTFTEFRSHSSFHGTVSNVLPAIEIRNKT